MGYIMSDVIRPRLPGAEGRKPGYKCGMAPIRFLSGSLLAAVVGRGGGRGLGVLDRPHPEERREPSTLGWDGYRSPSQPDFSASG